MCHWLVQLPTSWYFYVMLRIPLLVQHETNVGPDSSHLTFQDAGFDVGAILHAARMEWNETFASSDLSRLNSAPIERA